MAENAIFVSEMEKGFRSRKRGNIKVLKKVSFSVPAGTIYALLGSNGAGKTTTVRILTTQIKPDGGLVTVGGHDVLEEPRAAQRMISLTGQFSAVDDALTGKENLVIMGRLRQIPDPEKSAGKLLEYFELSDAADRPVSAYSGGMKRKLDIAMSLTGDPELLFLDEPTVGLDPQSRRAMWELIRKLNHRGMTVFLTTQYLDEAEELADRIGILNKGKIIAEGTMKELREANGNITGNATLEEIFLTMIQESEEQK